MARQLRVEFPGAFYHVMARGNEKKQIYNDDHDRQRFLDYLETATNRYSAVVHCYCLMGNHYHLMLETPAGNLSQIMHHVNGGYTTYFNKRHSRVGHLFQGRYKSILIDADTYCLSLSRYIHLNPVNDQACPEPKEYEWSSYRHYVAQAYKPKWLKVDFVLSLLSCSVDRVGEYKRYVEAVQNNSEDIWMVVESAQPVLGSEDFISQVTVRQRSQKASPHDLLDLKCFTAKHEIREVSTLAIKKTEYDHRLARKITIYCCHQYSRLSLKEIGEYFGLSDSAVSKSSKRFAAILVNDQRLAEIVAGLLAALKMSNVQTRPYV